MACIALIPDITIRKVGRHNRLTNLHRIKTMDYSCNLDQIIILSSTEFTSIKSGNADYAIVIAGRSMKTIVSSGLTGKKTKIIFSLICSTRN